MRLITFAQLGPEKGISRCRDHVRRLVKVGKFPVPIQLSEHKIASSGGRGSIGFSMLPLQATRRRSNAFRAGRVRLLLLQRFGIAAWHRAVDPETAALPAQIFR